MIAAELCYAVTHDMQPGEPVPSIAELAHMFRVNRKTARKAQLALVAELRTELRAGRRYFVPGERESTRSPVSGLNLARPRAASSRRVGGATA